MLSKTINILVILAVIVVSLAIFADSMLKPIGHDEQMYCTAGVLLAQGKLIYRDFSYVAQLPYHPLLCAALYKVLNTTHYLLVGRILSAVCDVLVVICIIGIYRRIFDTFVKTGLLLGLAAVVLYVFNPFVDYANGFAWNHDVVILCVMLSLWLFVSADFKSKSAYLRIALIGSLLTPATFMRPTTALVQLLFFVALLARLAESAKQRVKNISAFLVATAVVSLWPVWTILMAPQAFFLNVFHMPKLNSHYLHHIGLVWEKSRLIFLFFTTPGCFLLFLIAIYLCVIILWNRRKLSVSNSKDALFAVSLALMFFVIAFIPPTMWVQYLGVPVPFMVIAFAWPLLYLRKLAPYTYFKIAAVLVTACALVSAAHYPVVLKRIPGLLNPQNWAPVQLHNISQDIAARAKGSKLILTLAPLYALEGGCDIYTEFSAGPFAYRIADFMSPFECDITHTAGPKKLEGLVKRTPPSAMVLGVEPQSLEVFLFQAVKPDKQTWGAKTYDTGLIAYFEP